MSRYTNTNVSTISGVNSELQKVSVAINTLLDREGTAPNSMESDIDLNSNSILNVSPGVSGADAVNLNQLLGLFTSSNFTTADAKFIDTVAIAKADSTLDDGDVIILKDRAGGIFDVVLTSGVTPNTFDVIISTADSLISFVLRPHIINNGKEYGATGDNVTNDTSAIVAAGVGSYLPTGTYIADSASVDYTDFWGPGIINEDSSTLRTLSDAPTNNGIHLIKGDTIVSTVKSNQTSERQELQLYAGKDAHATNSDGAGIHLYGNRDEQHAGNITLLTGQPGSGDARINISGGSFQFSVTSITRSGSVATLTTSIDHDLTTSMLISVSGANETEYNVVQEALTVTGDTTLTYAVSGSPDTPATGTIVAAPGEGARFNTDTRITIGNSIFDFVDTLQDTALLSLKNPQGRPAILFLETNSTTEGEEAVPTGEAWSLGHWDAPTEVYTPRMFMSGDGEFFFGRVSNMTVNSSYVFEALDDGHRAGDFYTPSSETTRDVFRIYSDVGGSETNTLTIDADGDVLNVNNSYGALSDARYKDILSDASSQWEDCKNIEWVNYKLKNQVETMGDDAPTLLGVTTQQLIEKGIGGVTKHKPDEIDADTNDIITPEHYVAKYSVITMKYHVAFQEAQERIEALEKALATAIERLDSL